MCCFLLLAWLSPVLPWTGGQTGATTPFAFSTPRRMRFPRHWRHRQGRFRLWWCSSCVGLPCAGAGPLGVVVAGARVAPIIPNGQGVINVGGRLAESHLATTLTPMPFNTPRAASPELASSSNASALGSGFHVGAVRRRNLRSGVLRCVRMAVFRVGAGDRVRVDAPTAGMRRFAPARRWPQGGEPWLTDAHHGANAT